MKNYAIRAFTWKFGIVKIQFEIRVIKPRYIYHSMQYILITQIVLLRRITLKHKSL